MIKYEMTSGIISASVQIQDDESASSGDDDEFSDASQMGSSLTIKYKGTRSPLSSATTAAAVASSMSRPTPTTRDPSTVPLTNQSDDSSLSAESARSELMAAIKDKKLSESDSESGMVANKKKKSGAARTACLGLMGFLSVAVVAGVGLGALYFSTARNAQWMKSAQASSSLTAENDQLILKGESACRTVPASDYHAGLFTYGYDVTRARPLHKGLLDTPARAALRDERSLHECHLLNEASGECQLSAQSKVIDSLSAYYEWIGDRLVDEGDATSHAAALATSSHDRDLLAIQADLMSGFVIVVSTLSCPVWNVTRAGARPQLEPQFVQQLAVMADEDAELLEDFGTHYVEQAIVGGQAIVLYSMDRKSIERLKAKNVSLSVQASTASLYLYSRSNAGVNFSEKSAELALDFLSFAKTQLYDDAKDAPIPLVGSTNDGQLIHAALKSSGIISLKMRPIEELFNQLPFNGAKLVDYWRRVRSVLCDRLLTPRPCNARHHRQHDTEVSHSGKEDDAVNVHVLPLVSLGTNGTNTVYVRASGSRCVELCREDPLCSSVTLCTTGESLHDGPSSIACPVEFGASNCALHRQQEFQYATVNPGLSTLIPMRKDLRPVSLRGFSVHGHPLITSKQVTDLASCSRLCSRTPDCRVVSFSQHSTGHKSCRLYQNVTMNELRVQGHSTIVFMMATLGPCFPGEETNREVCPLNAECSPLYGMCVCPSGYRKSETGCIAPDKINDQIDEPLLKRAYHNKKHRSHSAAVVASSTTPAASVTATSTEETTTSTSTQAATTTTTTTTTAKAVVHTRLQTSTKLPGSPGTKSSTENYYIRGVFLPPETSSVSPKPTTTTYKPWQMRFGIGPPIGLSSKQTSAADAAPGGETAMKLESNNKHWNPRG